MTGEGPRKSQVKLSTIRDPTRGDVSIGGSLSALVNRLRETCSHDTREIHESASLVVDQYEMAASLYQNYSPTI